MLTWGPGVTRGILSKPLLEELQVKAEYLKETNISVLSLSVRSSNGLRRNGIDTIYKLIHCSERDLFRIRNIGVTCVEEIKDKINNFINKIPNSVKDTEITNMALLSYLESQGVQATQYRSIEYDSVCSQRKWD